jgi:pimeloyl-ACP methyl ester carboxylesterase
MEDLVLLHGALGASGQLDALGVALSSRFRVHLLDFEGHGNAQPRDRPFRMQFFAENVVELLDRERIGRARLFGYSMGGYVATYLAAEQPDRVASVATLGTKFRWDPETAAREAGRLDPATIRLKVPRFAEALAVRHANAGGWEAVLARTADLLRDLGDHPLLTDEVLARIAQRVHVIVGERDNTVSVDESSAVARALGSGSLTVMPDTPHPIEQVSIDALVHALTAEFSDLGGGA